MLSTTHLLYNGSNFINPDSPSSGAAQSGPCHMPSMHLILHNRWVPRGPTSAGKRTSLTSRNTLCSSGSSISSLSLSFSFDGISSSSESMVNCPSSSICPWDFRFDDDFLESDELFGLLSADVVLPANTFYILFPSPFHHRDKKCSFTGFPFDSLVAALGYQVALLKLVSRFKFS